MAGEERSFGPYRLAGRYGPLWRGNATVPLTAKTVAVLWELVRRAGQVVRTGAVEQSTAPAVNH